MLSDKALSDFVQPSLVGVPDWLLIHGSRTVWRLRGFGWFRLNVEGNVDKLKPLLADMEAQRASLPHWGGGGLNWDEPLSILQVYKARNGAPQRFDKAAKTLLLCIIAAAERKMPAATVLDHMRLEAAIFGISDFDQVKYKAALAIMADLPGRLRKETTQTTEKVFDDMALGIGVSYRLATLARQQLQLLVPALPWGDVIITSGVSPTGKRLTPQASSQERVEGPSIPPGARTMFP